MKGASYERCWFVTSLLSEGFLYPELTLYTDVSRLDTQVQKEGFMTSIPPPAKQVFISHAQEDNDFSRKLASALSTAGLSVWFDVGSLKPGERLDEVITRALHASDAFILVLSPAAVASHWVHSEWNEALERYEKGELRYFITIIATSCQVPIRLKTQLWIDFTTLAWDQACVQLIAGLGIQPMTREAPKVWELHRAIPTHVGIFGLCWSSDGRFIATASHDKTVRVWDVASAQCVQLFRGHENWVEAVAWSPDGRYIASASQGQRPRVWDVASGQLHALLTGHTGSISDVCWSPDGRAILTGSADSTVRIWDLATGTCRMILTDATKPITSVDWSPDGAWLSASSRDALIHLWQLPEGRHTQVLQGHQDVAFCARWSPDGARIASSGHTTVRLWKWQTGECLCVFEGHRGHVITVAWRPDGQIIASGSADHSIRLWGPNGDRFIITPGMQSDWVHGVAWSPDGMMIASGGGINDGRLMLWTPA
jgi:WD40 repeat protein